ncbi:RHS repeat-associated core domain-containing protein [Pseudomonas sp. G2-4]|uniref:RHS repeat-associated core domain-containing protein n=1 Tax=Pseudomonas sp. G2-4 TaxID=1506334 RepID=UPI0024B91F8F|nr:RHS repeat-associated core domain-containing protein [Pseudomonas sp. G2-4]WHS58934.1 RHS repeat-associated core domain-containing protein [Pseudomonas sp. G2-4]
MDQVRRIEQELDSLKDTLSVYREQLDRWYSRAADEVSHAADLPSLMGMERLIRFGDSSTAVSTGDDDFLSTVVQCPRGGVMTIESKLESVYDIPLGDIVVDVVAVDSGEVTPVALDAQGLGTFNGEPGRFYRVHVQGEVSSAQLSELFSSYDGLSSELTDWLRGEWQGFKPQWSQQSSATSASAVGNGLLAGSWAALEGVWDSISLLSDILKDPSQFVERLGSSAKELAELAESAPLVMTKLQLLASDEAALCLLVRTASLWLEMLPPSEIAGETAEALSRVTVQLLIDLLIGVVLTFTGAGAGIAYLSMRLAKVGAQLLDAMQRFIRGIFAVVNGFMTYVDRYKTVAARGIAAGIKKGRMQLRWDAQRNTTLKKHQPHDDAPAQSKNPNGDSADTAVQTQTSGCPVSMVTGEELLTLEDGTLDGRLPFVFTRLYRTSAVELDVGLGRGWSHALAHRLQLDGEQVIWIDQENRRTAFPLPNEQRPAIHNSLARAAIYRGPEPDELIIAQPGENAAFLHFRDGHLTALSDRYDNRLTLQRNIHGDICRLDNGAGRALRLRYEQRHLVAIDYQSFHPALTLDDAWRTEQTLVSYRYDGRFRLIEATNAVGESERYDYDDQHVILQRQLAGGASFFWEWQGAGRAARCVRHWASFAQMDSHYRWDEDGSVTVQHLDGSQEVYVHDDRARLVRKVEPDGGEHLKAYDAQGRLIAEQDPLGAVTEYRYDEAGRLVALIPPLDEPTSYEYRNGFLHARCRGKAVWTYRRNALGDVTERIDPDGQRTEYAYDPQGQLLAVDYPDGSAHRFTWNRLGQLTEETLPDGSQRHFSYDALGRLLSRQDEHGALTHYQWDAVGRLLQTTLPSGATRAWSYNAYGKVTSERDEQGRVTRYEYADDLHLISRRLNPDGTELKYRYDSARLLLTEIENESGEKYQLDYTPNGLIRQQIGFDGQRTAYAYDRNGHLLEKTEYGDDGSQLVTAYQRDAAGRLLVKTLPDGQAIEYRYDRLGRLVHVNDGSDHPLAFEYDAQDRLITEHQGWGTLRYGYDACGRLNHLRLPDDSKLDYHHARGGALTAINLNGSRLTEHHMRGGRERQRQQGLLRSQYDYDEQGRLKAQTVWQHQQQLFWRDYSYSAKGNLEALSDNRNRRNYQYDPLDRMVRIDYSHSEPPEHFAHDPAGNLLMLDRPGPTTFKGNRLLMEGDRHYDYDAFGNLIRERRGKGHSLVSEYRYDSLHRLIGVIQPDGREASYRYDAFGRRISKTVDGLTTKFFWQGDQLVAESSPRHHRSYLYEPGTFRPLAMLDGKGLNACPFYYHLDHLGTPQELTNYGGQVVWSARYNGYGKTTELAHGGGEQLEQPLRFQGQYFDPESGLHYNRHRYYNPGTGRYLTPDPSKLAGGLNGYRYTVNPTGWVDPLGLVDCPGKGGCRPAVGEQDPAAKVGVDEGEPRLPMTAEQRRARIDELGEANAYRRLEEMERSIEGAHFLQKHGAQTTADSQLERVRTGRNPGTGEIDVYERGRNTGQPAISSAATRFLSHRDQLNAIHRAQLIFRRAGIVASKKPIEMGRVIGEGYKREGLEYGKQTKAIVILDRNGMPKTAYTGSDI